MATDTEQRVAIRNKAVGTYSQHPKTAAERKRYADMTPEQDARNKKRRATNEAVKRVRDPTNALREGIIPANHQEDPGAPHTVSRLQSDTHNHDASDDEAVYIENELLERSEDQAHHHAVLADGDGHDAATRGVRCSIAAGDSDRTLSQHMFRLGEYWRSRIVSMFLKESLLHELRRTADGSLAVNKALLRLIGRRRRVINVMGTSRHPGVRSRGVLYMSAGRVDGTPHPRPGPGRRAVRFLRFKFSQTPQTEPVTVCSNPGTHPRSSAPKLILPAEAGSDDVWDSCISIVKRHTWRFLNRTTRALSGGIAPTDPAARFAAEPQARVELRKQYSATALIMMAYLCHSLVIRVCLQTPQISSPEVSDSVVAVAVAVGPAMSALPA
ncbi:hypothetical protein Q7P36_000884 [Cladosporium allicinum]